MYVGIEKSQKMLIWKHGLKQYTRDFFGSPVVKTPHLHFKGHGWIPDWGIKIPHATRYGQNKIK